MSPSGRTTAQAAGLLLAGAVAGGVLAATFTASASSPAAGSPGPSSYAATGPGAGGYGPDRHHGPGRFGPMQAGTVTSVGTKSVTIKSTAGTKMYAVDSNSDIDKNGEAKLSDLKVGDAVRFNVVTVDGKKTIGILHSGNEELNRPDHGPGPGTPGSPGTPGGPTTENSNTGFTNA